MDKSDSNLDRYIWAEEFCRVAKEINFDPNNKEHQDWIDSWIANAILLWS